MDTKDLGAEIAAAYLEATRNAEGYGTSTVVITFEKGLGIVSIKAVNPAEPVSKDLPESSKETVRVLRHAEMLGKDSDYSDPIAPEDLLVGKQYRMAYVEDENRFNVAEIQDIDLLGGLVTVEFMDSPKHYSFVTSEFVFRSRTK
jgi:hypothetical protein